MALDLDKIRNTVESMDFSLVSFQKSRLWGTGITQNNAWWVKCIPRSDCVSKYICLELLVCSIAFKNCNFRKKKNPHFHFCNIFTGYFIAIIYVLTLIIIKCPEIWLCCVIICYLYNEFLLFHHLKMSALPAYLILILLYELQEDCTSWVKGGLFSELITQLHVMSQASLFHTGVLKLLPELAKKAHLKWELFSTGAVAIVLKSFHYLKCQPVLKSISITAC